MQTSNSIQNSSSKIMNFVVDDLLDFAQLNNNKFRKNVVEFDLREALAEVISIQKEKAVMQNIKLRAHYKPQSIEDNKESCCSFFNNHEKP